MFYESIRFQIAAALFLLIMVVSYLRNKKLPLSSTRWFRLIILGICVNLLFDVITVYTVSHQDIVPMWINRLCHQIFIGSLDAILMFLFFYISVLGHAEQRYSFKEYAFRLLPFAASLIMVIFGELEYSVKNGVAFSHGLMADSVYFSCAAYIIASLFTIYKYRKTIPSDRARSILVGIGIWSAAALIQLFFPFLLISGLSLVMLLFVIFLSLENPREFHNVNTGCFNEMAYQKMVNDKFARRQSFYTISVVIREYDVIQNNYSREAAEALVKAVASYVQSVTGQKAFNMYDNMLILFADTSKDSVMKSAEIIAERFEKEWNFGYAISELIAHIDIIACPEYAKNPTELLSICRFMAHQTRISQIHIINEDDINQHKRVIQVEEVIREALEKDGFDVFYQPIFSVTEQRFISAEALVRLKSTEQLGYVSPEEFIPIAEKKGLIMQIGACVFRKVCIFIKEMGLKELGIHYIEVNLSGIQCMDAELPIQLQTIMQEHGIDPKQINLEITETATVESGTMLRKSIHKLRKLGCSFSMDDFGTGYSNLSQMAEIRYDLIKIDKSLIWPCFDNNGKKSRIILENIVNMITALGIGIVAEGVETSEQADRLAALGINYLQGYFFSRPICEIEFVNFIEKKA